MMPEKMENSFSLLVNNLTTMKRSIQYTCINQKPVVKKGDRVLKGQVIADGPCTDKGELALGRNVLVAFMPWRGYNFEDAILVSEKMVKEDYYTSVHIEEFEIEARDTKLGPEEITRDIPNVSESALRDLHDERTNKRLLTKGAMLDRETIERISTRNLKRIKYADKDPRVNEQIDEIEEMTSRQIDVLRKITNEKISKLQKGDELPPGVIKLVKCYVAMKRKLSVGDKMAGRHGNKGVIARILPEEDMPYLADVTPAEIGLNPLGVPSRMNVGQILETHLGWAGYHLGERIKEFLQHNTREEAVRRELKSIFKDTPIGEEITALEDDEVMN